MAASKDETRIRHDFEKLRSDPVIRNGYYWVAVTRGDWVEWSKRLLELARAADLLLTKELARR